MMKMNAGIAFRSIFKVVTGPFSELKFVVIPTVVRQRMAFAWF